MIRKPEQYLAGNFIRPIKYQATIIAKNGNRNRLEEILREKISRVNHAFLKVDEERKLEFDIYLSRRWSPFTETYRKEVGILLTALVQAGYTVSQIKRTTKE